MIILKLFNASYISSYMFVQENGAAREGGLVTATIPMYGTAAMAFTAERSFYTCPSALLDDL